MMTNKVISKHNLLIFLLWALFISFPFWAFGSSSYLRLHDSADGRLSTRIALDVNEEQGEVGYWNPDMFAGIDRLSEGNSLELINLLFYFLPGWVAYAVFMFLQRWVAGYFTYRLITDHLRVRPWLALLAGAYYSLFPMQIYNSQVEGFVVPNAFTLSILPLLLWCLVHISTNFEKQRLKNTLFVLGLGLLLAATSSFAFSVFLFPVLVVILVFIFDQNIVKVALIIGIFGIGWLMLEQQEIISSYIHSLTSNRTLRSYCYSRLGNRETGPQFERLLLKASYVPYLYFSFVGLAFFRRNKLYKHLIYFSILTIGLVLSSVHVPRLVCMEQLPLDFISGFNFSRFSLMVPFSTMLLFSVSLENGFQFLADSKWAVKRTRVRQYVPVFILLVFGIVLGVQTKNSLNTMLTLRGEGLTYRNIFENPYLEYLSELVKAEDDPSVRAVLVAHNLVDEVHPGYLWPYGINTLDGYTVIYPLRFAEYWRMILDPMITTYPDCRYGIKFGEGSNRAYLSTNCEVGEIEDSLVVDDWFNMKLLSLGGAKYFVSQQPLEQAGLRELDTSEIRCDFECIEYRIYVNDDVSGFVTAYANYVGFPSVEKLLMVMTKEDAEKFDNVVFLKSGDVTGVPLKTIAAGGFDYQAVDYSADRIVLEITTDAPKIVQINMAYSPYWRAYSNGQRVKIFPANHLFIGIYVPEGASIIELRYEPPYSIYRWID